MGRFGTLDVDVRPAWRSSSRSWRKREPAHNTAVKAAGEIAVLGNLHHSVRRER
jgi:hypothetical protein